MDNLSWSKSKNYWAKGKNIITEIQIELKWPIILLLILIFYQGTAEMCSATSTASFAISKMNDNFISITIGSAEIYGVKVGPVSSDLYYMYRITTHDSTGIRRIKPDDSSAWIFIAPLIPWINSLSIDSSEQSVYIASYASPLQISKFSAENGEFSSSQIL